MNIGNGILVVWLLFRFIFEVAMARRVEWKTFYQNVEVAITAGTLGAAMTLFYLNHNGIGYLVVVLVGVASHAYNWYLRKRRTRKREAMQKELSIGEWDVSALHVVGEIIRYPQISHFFVNREGDDHEFRLMHLSKNEWKVNTAFTYPRDTPISPISVGALVAEAVSVHMTNVGKFESRSDRYAEGINVRIQGRV